MPRIIGGQYRSRRLHTPPDSITTRPYTDRVKESVFNLLRGWFDGTNVVDLFAGVGTMGLEAASRGAASVLMVEHSKQMVELARRNIAEFGCGGRVEVIQADALGTMWTARAPRPVHVLFVDPPYDLMQRMEMRRRVLDGIVAAKPLLAEQSFVVLRTPMEPASEEFTLAGYDGPEVHCYGKQMHVLLYAPSSKGTVDELG
jgi:16S rRNA (guanine966-N2)-methyltransferase